MTNSISSDNDLQYFSGVHLWSLLEESSNKARRTQSVTATAIDEVNRYLADPPIDRNEDPLTYWRTHKTVYPNLYQVAKHFLCTPASSVPCERVFSKAGEIVSKKRNRLNPLTVEKLLFLNKNS